MDTNTIDTATIPSGRLTLRVQETADTLGLSRAKTYELIADGTIPSVRMGGSIRVPVDALRQRLARLLADQAGAQ